MALPSERADMPWAYRISTATLDTPAPEYDPHEDLLAGNGHSNALADKRFAHSKSLYNDLRKENDVLKKALQQCHKCEGAVRNMFLRNYEKEKEISKNTLYQEKQDLDMWRREHLLELEKEQLEAEHNFSVEQKLSLQSMLRSKRRLRKHTFPNRHEQWDQVLQNRRFRATSAKP